MGNIFLLRQYDSGEIVDSDQIGRIRLGPPYGSATIRPQDLFAAKSGVAPRWAARSRKEYAPFERRGDVDYGRRALNAEDPMAKDDLNFFVGLDWGTASHTACVTDVAGQVIGPIR